MSKLRKENIMKIEENKNKERSQRKVLKKLPKFNKKILRKKNLQE